MSTKIPRIFPLIVVVMCVLPALYLGTFLGRLGVFGAPVRNPKYDWLGPPRRGDLELVDIGKVSYYEGRDYGDYRVFRPLCRFWLSVTGL